MVILKDLLKDLRLAKEDITVTAIAYLPNGEYYSFATRSFHENKEAVLDDCDDLLDCEVLVMNVYGDGSISIDIKVVLS